MEGGEHVEDFDAIYRRHLREVYRFLLKLSGDSDVAEELTQETFTIAFEKLAATKTGEKSLYGCVRSRSLSFTHGAGKTRSGRNG